MIFRMGKRPTLISTAALILVLAVLSTSLIQVVHADQPAGPNRSDDSNSAPDNPALVNSVFVPLLFADHPWDSPFGIESSPPLIESNNMLSRAVELPVGFVRLGNQISWRILQPNPGDSPKWELLAGFDDELRGLKAAGIRPVVVIKDHPFWALDPVKARDADGNLTSCGAIAKDYFDEFATFAGQLVERYKTDEFNVHDWELGNEPDVDPTEVPQNYPFGCWGDKSDPYYGGRHYGEMLKVVAPAIRKADSRAQIWIGGLLLNNPASSSSSSMSMLLSQDIEALRNTPYASSATSDGLPEQFFKGILEAG
ncbi:MAG: hypothetical protein ACWGO1_10075, partial [Anaerolineales bacterium]